MFKSFQNFLIKNRKRDQPKMWNCMATGVEAFLNLTPQQHTHLNKLAKNSGYSGYNIFMINFTRLINHHLTPTEKD